MVLPQPREMHPLLQLRLAVALEGLRRLGEREEKDSRRYAPRAMSSSSRTALSGRPSLTEIR